LLLLLSFNVLPLHAARQALSASRQAVPRRHGQDWHDLRSPGAPSMAVRDPRRKRRLRHPATMNRISIRTPETLEIKPEGCVSLRPHRFPGKTARATGTGDSACASNHQMGRVIDEVRGVRIDADQALDFSLGGAMDTTVHRLDATSYRLDGATSVVRLRHSGRGEHRSRRPPGPTSA